MKNASPASKADASEFQEKRASARFFCFGLRIKCSALAKNSGRTSIFGIRVHKPVRSILKKEGDNTCACVVTTTQ